MKALTVRVQDELHDEAAVLLESLGLNMTTAVNVFLRQCVINRAIPFPWRSTRSGTGSGPTTATSAADGVAAFGGRPKLPGSGSGRPPSGPHRISAVRAEL